MTTSRASLAASLALGAVVLAAPGVRALEEAPRPPTLMRLQERLGLTDDQTRAIREIHERQRESWHRLAQALRRGEQELRQLALGGADDATLQAKMDEVGRLRQEALRLRVRTLQELAPVLTQEQRERLGQGGWWGPGPKGPQRQRS